MSSQRKKILVVDDEERIRSIYVRVLIESGLVARWASNAHQAINIIIREPINLVLLDIHMPGIDGKMLFDIIREYDPLLKIIVASVYPLHVQRQMIPQAYDYYDKCYGPNLFLEKTLDALGQKTLGSQASLGSLGSLESVQKTCEML